MNEKPVHEALMWALTNLDVQLAQRRETLAICAVADGFDGLKWVRHRGEYLNGTAELLMSGGRTVAALWWGQPSGINSEPNGAEHLILSRYIGHGNSEVGR